MSGRRSSNSDGTAGGNRGKDRGEWPRDDRELRRRLADEDGDRVLELRARDPRVEHLRLRGLELRLGLRDIAAGDDAGRVLIARELQRPFVAGDRILEQSDLRVLHAQQQVALRQQRLRRQPRRGEVRRARLRARFARLDAAPHAAPQVDFPAQVERDVVAVGDARRSSRWNRCRWRASCAAPRRWR